MKKQKKYQPRRLNSYGHGRNYSKKHRPFWLPASSFYILTAAIAIAIFFLIWGILLEGGEESPWIPAGMASSIILGSAVFLREVILGKARKRYLLAEKRLDYNLKNVPVKRSSGSNTNKLSLRKNAEIISNIQKKSEAAKILSQLPDGHWEVFEMCNQYLLENEKQLINVGVGSPRLAALRRGKEIVGKLHKYHLLNWTEIESRLLTQEASTQVNLSDKIEVTQRALAVLDSSLQFYPDDSKLAESKQAVQEFLASIKISHWIEQAERETFKKNYLKAISLYRDSLFYLARENIKSEERAMIAEQINNEIDRIRELENDYEDESKKIISKNLVNKKNDKSKMSKMPKQPD